MSDIIQQSVYIDYSEQQTLHLRYIAQDNATGPAIFLCMVLLKMARFFIRIRIKD